MPRFSTKTVNAMLIKATGIKGYVPQGLKTAINKTKISSNFGPKRVKDVLGGKSNSNIDQNTLNKIFEKIDETGALKTSWAESKEKFTREVAKQQRIEDRQQKIDKQIEQNTKSNTNKTAPENPKKNQAGIKQPETIKPKDEKASKITASRLETERVKRGLEARFRGKLGEVMESQSKFRKTWGKSADIVEVKSRGGGGGGMAAEGKPVGLFNKAMQEEEDKKSSPKGSKGGQKSGGNTTTNQKASGPKMVGLRGLASIGELSSQSEISNNENIPAVFHVEGLDKAPASQPEAPPIQKSSPTSTSAPEDPDELNI